VRRLRAAVDLALFAAGPYLEDAAYGRLRAAAADVPSVRLVRYEPRLTAWIRAADLVVAAAGANVIGEVVAARANAVLVPRQLREKEQEMHAGRMADLGLARVITRTGIAAGRLPAVIRQALEQPPAGRAWPRCGGGLAAAEHLTDLLGRR
jgi:predicted glycosyltransferase